jgi:hypothetical protein
MFYSITKHGWIDEKREDFEESQSGFFVGERVSIFDGRPVTGNTCV